MFRAQMGRVWALCALLSVGICVIITGGATEKSAAASAQTGHSRPVLILDPGHGGLDGGAVSVTGTRESSINWQITARLYDLARFMGMETLRTREREEIEYPPELKTVSAKKKWDTRERAGTANGTDNGILISIHQNCFPGAGPRGIQVLYRDEEQSAALAGALQKQLAAIAPGSEKRHAVRAGKDIYLMNHVTVPAVLVECGFLSNSAEAVLLETSGHQKKIAVIIAAVYYGFTGDETA